MKKKNIFPILIILAIVFVFVPLAQAQASKKMVMRYRIEVMKKNKWQPIKETKKFKRGQTIRFRFMCNTAGTLYVLNTHKERASLEPVFKVGSGASLRQRLGTGTDIGANQVGVFPDQDKGGGGLRFTGVKGWERFLFVFVPQELEYTRAMMAIAAGAENWQFDAKTTYTVTGDPGNILFHYFTLKSKR